MQTDVTLLSPTCCVRLHGTTTMLGLFGTCCVFDTGQTFRPMQTDAILLVNNTQQCWTCCDLLHPFACCKCLCTIFIQPNAFKDLFKKVSNRHAYNTRLIVRQTYSLPSVITNYGKFNLRFIGAKIWNTTVNTRV